MIKEMKPLSLVEAKKIIEEHKGREDIEPYFKKFIKVKEKDAEEMKKEISALDNHRIKQEHIAKIIDFMPETISELNKIFTETSLGEEEAKQVIDIVKKESREK